MKSPLVVMRQVRKVYDTTGNSVVALGGIDLDIRVGEFVAVLGPSGSGKTTLINLMGCLDRATNGTYLLNGEDVHSLTDDELSWLRNRIIGFIFQSYNLVPSLTVAENVELPLVYGGQTDRTEAVRSVLAYVGMEKLADARAGLLSGGEQQRAAIARALINDPSLILADEPTGSLDSQNAAEVLKLLSDLNSRGRTVVLVTHNAAVAKHTERAIYLEDGLVASQKAA